MLSRRHPPQGVLLVPCSPAARECRPGDIGCERRVPVSGVSAWRRPGGVDKVRSAGLVACQPLSRVSPVLVVCQSVSVLRRSARLALCALSWHDTQTGAKAARRASCAG